MGRDVEVLSGINILLGGWLTIAPFVLEYSDRNAMWTSIVVGVLVVVLAWIHRANPISGHGMSRFNVLLGIWLIIAPFVLGFSNLLLPTGNDILVGLAISIFGFWSVRKTPA